MSDLSTKGGSAALIAILFTGLVIAMVGAVACTVEGTDRSCKKFASSFNTYQSTPVPAPTIFVPVNKVSQPVATPIPKPSDRALKAAAWLVAHSTKAQLDNAMNKNPSLGKTSSDVVKNMAKFYDLYPEKLALLEAEIEKYNLEEQKTANKQTIIYKEAPSIFNSIHCTSRTDMFGTTRTNCY